MSLANNSTNIKFVPHNHKFLIFYFNNSYKSIIARILATALPRQEEYAWNFLFFIFLKKKTFYEIFLVELNPNFELNALVSYNMKI